MPGESGVLAAPPEARPVRGPISIEELGDDFMRTPIGQELLVPADDPDGGPYSDYIRVAEGEVAAQCRSGYRRVTGYEQDIIIDEPEDYTEGWNHSDW